MDWRENLLRSQAAKVNGTEAVSFTIEGTKQVPILRQGRHIRADNSSFEQRAAAIAAFKEIIKPCLQQGKDGVVEILSDDDAPNPQFCLVTILRKIGDMVAVNAVITRCKNSEEGKRRLMQIQAIVADDLDNP